jgi:hypothetical protein
VPIRIQCNWQPLGEGTLGATSSPWLVAGSRDDADKLDDNTLYGSVMAMALQGKDFVAPSEFHVTMSFNSVGVVWHFDTSTATPIGKWDHATTSLHEAGHALFFSGAVSALAEESTASFATGSGHPGRFDRFLAASTKAGVAESCTGKKNFYDALTNSGLRFTDRETPGVDFSLFSPFPFRAGSSVYHHDPARLKQDCHDNNIAESECSDLMTQELLNGYTERAIGKPVRLTMQSVLGKAAGLGKGSCDVESGSAVSSRSNGHWPGSGNLPAWLVGTMAGVAVVLGGILLAGIAVSVARRRRANAALSSSHPPAPQSSRQRHAPRSSRPPRRPPAVAGAARAARVARRS